MIAKWDETNTESKPLTVAQYSSFHERFVRAAERALKQNAAVGPLELLQEMRFLHPIHVAGWRKGNEDYRALQKWIQVGPEKFQKTILYFREWAKQRGLQTIEASFIRQGPGSIETLQVLKTGTRNGSGFIARIILTVIWPRRRVPV